MAVDRDHVWHREILKCDEDLVAAKHIQANVLSALFELLTKLRDVCADDENVFGTRCQYTAKIRDSVQLFNDLAQFVDGARIEFVDCLALAIEANFIDPLLLQLHQLNALSLEHLFSSRCQAGWRQPRN